MAGLVVELVLELDREHRSGRAAPVEGAGECAEPLPHEVEVRGVVGAVPHRRVLHPVGESAVAHLAVHPRADPQHDLESFGAHRVDERRDVEAPVEARLPPDRFVVEPRHVRRHDRDAARPHEPQPWVHRSRGTRV